MGMTLGELAGRVGATIASGDPDRIIDAANSLADADIRQLAPFTDAKYVAQLQKTRAGAVLAKIQPAEADIPAGTALLLTPDPEIAFVTALNLLHPETHETPGIDPRAVVEPGAEIGENVYLGPYAVLRKGARIGARSVIMAHAVVSAGCELGEDCRIYPHAVLYEKVKLGHRVIVHAGAVLGADGFGFKFRNGKHIKVPQVGTVEIGDDVEIGANACVDRGALSPTRIGSGTKIDNLVQIGHGVSIGKHCILCGQAGIAGSSGMDDYAVLGANAGLADHVFMGKGARAGAKSGIARDVPPFTEVFGLYSEERKSAFKQLAAVRRLPDLIERVRALERQLAKLQSPGNKENTEIK